MLYRIDYDKFLLHMIDHFTREELLHMQYLIISAVIRNAGHVPNVVKCNELYPSADVVSETYGTHDMDVLRRAYMSELKSKDPIVNFNMRSIYYRFILNPIDLHHDVCIICDKNENMYIDILCEFLKDEFGLDTINLNTLFTKGRVGSIYIDWTEVHNNVVDINRAVTKEMRDSLTTSRDGRTKLVYNIMNKKEKIKLLDEYGITPTSTKNEDLNEMLKEVYIDEIEE